MDISLTYDEILGLPNEIIRLSSTHSAYNELLDSNISYCYDTRELKGKIAAMFNRFKMLKYKCNIPIESKIKLSISYDVEHSSTSNRVNNQIENIVLKNTDDLLWGTSFYNMIIEVSKVLTEAESSYLVNAFFANKSEEYISEKLLMCRKSLYKVKRSCLVKLWFRLETLYSESA